MIEEIENVWGFGQVVPIFSLALPILTTIDIYYGIRSLLSMPIDGCILERGEGTQR